MKFSLIAVQFETKYYSIQCRHDGEQGLLDMLMERFQKLHSVLKFVGHGDIDLHLGAGSLVKGIRPVEHQSPLALAEYATTTEADELFVYDGQWDSIPLHREVIDVLVVSEG